MGEKALDLLNGAPLPDRFPEMLLGVRLFFTMVRDARSVT